MNYTQTWRCSDPSKAAPANTVKLSDTYSLISSDYNTGACQSPGNNCSIAENRCIQTTPDSQLPSGIDASQVAPDGCYKRENIYACKSTPDAQLSSCIASKTTCIDSTPSKIINGVTVTLEQAGGCWKYQDDCVSNNSIDYCAPLAASGQCTKTAETCIQSDPVLNTGCMKYDQTWRCSDSSTPTPSNAVKLQDSYTLTSSVYDTRQCDAMSAKSNCQVAETYCSNTTPPALPPGIEPSQVAPDGCYEKTSKYACLTGLSDSSDCDQYANNPKCEKTGSTCDTTEDQVAGQCTIENRTYRCEKNPAKTTTEIDCSGQRFCAGGKCFDQGYENDKDFGVMMALTEMARQGGTYGPQIFSGNAEGCEIKVGGLGQCCKSSGGGGGFSNTNIVSASFNIAGQAVKQVASPYVYDAFYSSGVSYLQGVAFDYYTSPAASVLGSSFGMYGFGYSTTVAAGNLAAGSAGTTWAIGEGALYFNPYAFAAAVAIQLVMEMTSCTQAEQQLGMKRGQDLCHYVGEYCSQKMLKVCITKKRNYCCYNSRLARIVNEQGRSQINKSWGSASSPDCSGFTEEQFASLDFSAMDLSEFISEIMSKVNIPSQGELSSRAGNSVTTKIQNYYSN